MKKAISIIVVIIGIVLAVLGIIVKTTESATVSIIGGADGPTAVFVAGTLGNGVVVGSILIGVLLSVVGIIVFWKMKE